MDSWNCGFGALIDQAAPHLYYQRRVNAAPIIPASAIIRYCRDATEPEHLPSSGIALWQRNDHATASFRTVPGAENLTWPANCSPITSSPRASGAQAIGKASSDNRTRSKPSGVGFDSSTRYTVPTLLVGSTGEHGGQNDAIQHMSRVRR